MEEIEEGYAVPTSMKVWESKIGEQAVIACDFEVIVPGADMEPQRAVLVFTTEDAAALASNINKAIKAGEGN